MKMREILFLLIWLFLGLFINRTVFDNHPDFFFKRRNPDIGHQIGETGRRLGEAGREIGREFAQSGKGIAEGASEFSRAMEELARQMHGLGEEMADSISSSGVDIAKLGATRDTELSDIAGSSKLKNLSPEFPMHSKKLGIETFDLEGATTVEFRLWPGTFEFVSGGELSADVELFAEQGSDGEFEEFAANFKISKKITDSTLVLKIGDRDLENRDISAYAGARGRITVPKGVAVVLRGSYNDISASDLDGDFDFELPRGAMFASNLNGPLTATVFVGRIELENIDGDAEVTITAGDTSVYGFEGDIKIAATGNVILDEIDGDAEVSIGAGNLDCTGVTGDFTCSVAAGNVTISRIDGAATIRLGTGELIADGIEAGVTARVANGNATLKRVKGEVELACGVGNLTVRGTDAGDLESLTAKVTTGNLALGASRLDKLSITAETNAGKISLDAANAHPVSKGIGASLSWGDGEVTAKLTAGTGNITVEEE
ncbi:MAG: DUF4097 family beta strand repeat protein [bacterium]|jgi:hypothetical protein